MSTSAAMRETAGQVWASLGMPVAAIAVILLILEIASPGAQEGLWLAPVVFLVLGIIHEWGHVLAIALVGSMVTAVRRDGPVLVAIQYDRPTHWRDKFCIVSGAGLAAVVSIGLAFVLWPTALALFTLLVGAAHLLALAVPIGDGANLRTRRAGAQTT